MTAVDLVQNVKTYDTTQCKFLLILKTGVPVFIKASWIQLLNCAKPFCCVFYLHIYLSEDANRIVWLLMALKKQKKKQTIEIKWPVRAFG